MRPIILRIFLRREIARRRGELTPRYPENERNQFPAATRSLDAGGRRQVQLAAPLVYMTGIYYGEKYGFPVKFSLCLLNLARSVYRALGVTRTWRVLVRPTSCFRRLRRSGSILDRVRQGELILLTNSRRRYI